MTRSGSSGCLSSSAPLFVRRPPKLGCTAPRYDAPGGPLQCLIMSANACPEFTPSYFCFWVTEITSARPAEADCRVGWTSSLLWDVSRGCPQLSPPRASRAPARQTPAPPVLKGTTSSKAIAYAPSDDKTTSALFFGTQLELSSLCRMLQR